MWAPLLRRPAGRKADGLDRTAAIAAANRVTRGAVSMLTAPAVRVEVVMIVPRVSGRTVLFVSGKGMIPRGRPEVKGRWRIFSFFLEIA
jgi:hypothetical protein